REFWTAVWDEMRKRSVAIAADSFADSRAARRFGIAIVAMTAMIAITIISSIRVNPLRRAMVQPPWRSPRPRAASDEAVLPRSGRKAPRTERVSRSEPSIALNLAAALREPPGLDARRCPELHGT